MKVFYCSECQTQIFFANSFCQGCQKPVGYIPARQEVTTFQMTDQGWLALNGTGSFYDPCANYQQYNVCNWMVEKHSHSAYCSSCQLTQVIPNLHEDKNIEYWAKLELAKRRFLYMTQRLNIFPRPKQHDQDPSGLSFHFLIPTEQQPVLTGHANGVITVNAFEADHLYRESARISMGENYRTLLGHFRHESGHYYFEILIQHTHWLEQFRLLFGDERQDYAQALQHYYEHGVPNNWQNDFISPYASSHPWEDWAETWAHYLHMISTLDTAYHTGMQIQKQRLSDPELVFEESPVGGKNFDLTLKNWFGLSYGLNALNRSMGLEDAYPFTLSEMVLKKLNFIHQVLLDIQERMS